MIVDSWCDLWTWNSNIDARAHFLSIQSPLTSAETTNSELETTTDRFNLMMLFRFFLPLHTQSGAP